jgi:ABC-type antimicrobial peptide transport system ATPase subunit
MLDMGTPCRNDSFYEACFSGIAQARRAGDTKCPALRGLDRAGGQPLGLSSPLAITHPIGVIEAIADCVAVMRAGRIEEQGDCDQVPTRPTREYTRTLLAAVPRLQAA